jgi:uncharacterized protein with von Willebrand factor type A (vWA) domain
VGVRSGRRESRRRDRRTPTEELLRAYGPDWRCVFVGDASMSPYEIVQPGGSVEHFNPEAGSVWLQRAFARWPAHVWINPAPPEHWGWTRCIAMVAELAGGRMLAMTLDGLDAAMRAARR